ncbi:MAG: hypothetical protein ACHQ50_00125 [Fimbriimonadales bacterium]
MRRARRLWLIGGIVAVVAALVWFFPPWFYRDSQEAAIQEAMARRLLTGWSQPGVANLTVDGGALPSTALVDSLKDLGLNIRGGGAHYTGTNNGFFVDDVTHEPLVICQIGKIHWRNLVTVEIEASCSEGLMGGSGATYTLRRMQSGWTVVDQAGTWVS